MLVWAVDVLRPDEDTLLRALLVTTVAAVSLAHANLLLLLAHHRHRAMRLALAVTLTAIAAVAVLIVVPVFAESWFGEPYVRVLGVLGIVDALGTVALPVLARTRVLAG